MSAPISQPDQPLFLPPPACTFRNPSSPALRLRLRGAAPAIVLAAEPRQLSFACFRNPMLSLAYLSARSGRTLTLFTGSLPNMSSASQDAVRRRQALAELTTRDCFFLFPPTCSSRNLRNHFGPSVCHGCVGHTCSPNSRRDALPQIREPMAPRCPLPIRPPTQPATQPPIHQPETLGPQCPSPIHPPTQPVSQPPIHQSATCLATHSSRHPANHSSSQPLTHRSAKPSRGHKSWPQVGATSLTLLDGGSYSLADLAEAAGAEAAALFQTLVQSLAKQHRRREGAPCQPDHHAQDAEGRHEEACGTSTKTAQEGASAAQPGKRNMWHK